MLGQREGMIGGAKSPRGRAGSVGRQLQRAGTAGELLFPIGQLCGQRTGTIRSRSAGGGTGCSVRTAGRRHGAIYHTSFGFYVGQLEQRFGETRFANCPHPGIRGRGFKKIFGADGGGRTHTLLRVLDFESSASANSATSATKISKAFCPSLPRQSAACVENCQICFQVSITPPPKTVEQCRCGA